MPDESSSIQGRAHPNEMLDFPSGGPINSLAMLTINLAAIKEQGIPPWSIYPQVRDQFLRIYSKQEPIMAGALYTFISRIKTLRWNIANGGRNTKKYYQRIFAEADGGRGFGEFIEKVVNDLLTQDNGAFIELVGAGRVDKPLVGRVTEIWHLDSAQCWRTFDPEFPVIYQNPTDNTYKRLHKTRVIMLSSNAQPYEKGRSVGFCAVSRAFRMMQAMKNIQIYKDEKVSGRFKRGLIYGNGLTPKTFKQSMAEAEIASENQNFTMYNEIPVLLSMQPDMKLAMLDLASLPDGFEYEKEITIYVYILALCFGTDAREFWPATASGATKADATVQHMKAQGKGVGEVIKTLETAFNWSIMPGNGESSFEYDYTDDEQDKLKAELDGLKAANIALMQQNQWIDQFEARALAIAQGLFDPKDLLTVEYPDAADDSGPIDTELTGENAIIADVPPPEPVQPGAVNTFDTTGGVKAGTDPFKEQLHPRDNSGKFGSGGAPSVSVPSQGGPTGPAGSAAPAGGQPGTAAPAPPPLTPLADRLKSFLAILNQRGSFDGNEMTIVQQARDRSADLQMYLRHKGFPNAVVTAKRKGKGWVYTIDPGDGSQAAPKKPKKPKKPRNPRKKKPGSLSPRGKGPKKTRGRLTIVKKAMTPPAEAVAEYADQLQELMQGFIDDVGDGVTGAKLQKLLDSLYADYVALVQDELTAAYGIGLAGADETDAGVERLQAAAQTSVEYFRDSFIPDLEKAADEWYAENQTGEKGLTGFIARIRLYAGTFWQAIWEGVGDRLSQEPKTLRVRRVLNPAADHCKTCPAKAKIYDSYATMVAEVGVPGDGSDDCGSNCRCTLEVETEPGSGIFEPLIGVPTVYTTPLFEVIP